MRDCGTATFRSGSTPRFEVVRLAISGLLESLHNRKRPTGEAGRFWGYYREERYVSLYMWICGRWVSPVWVMGAVVGSNGAMYDAGLDLKALGVAPYVGISTESLNSVRTYVRFVCEADHRDLDRS
jgi:hypothetical protein